LFEIGGGGVEKTIIGRLSIWFIFTQSFWLDLRKEFIECGYELFQDGPTSNKPCPITFFAGDVLDKESLSDMKGRVNYIYTAGVFHLFDKETQLKLAERLLDILDIPSQTVALTVNRVCIIFGMHEGREEEQVIKDRYGETRYGHSPISWNRMWEEVIGRRYGDEKVKSHVKLDAHLNDPIKVREMVFLPLVWNVQIRF
jgi:hypothetical protein